MKDQTEDPTCDAAWSFIKKGLPMIGRPFRQQVVVSIACVSEDSRLQLKAKGFRGICTETQGL